jgi:hypothetical protein
MGWGRSTVDGVTLGVSLIAGFRTSLRHRFHQQRPDVPSRCSRWSEVRRRSFR